MKRKSMLRKLIFPLAGLLIIIGIQSCKTFAGANPSVSVVAPVLEDQQFSTFRNLVNASGLTTKLQDQNSRYTIFSPTNDAFLKLGNDKISELMKPENSESLKALVQRHIFTGSLDKESLVSAGTTPASLAGKAFPVRNISGKWYIGNAHPIRNPTTARNGLFYAIDAVLE